MNFILNKIRATSLWWKILLVVLINILASAIHLRFDLTKEKRYTISAAAEKIISQLEEPIRVEVFLKGEFPSGFKKLANSTEDFLKNIKEINNSNISYEFISPLDIFPGTEQLKYRDTLIASGAVPINLTVQVKEGQQQQFIFPVAIIHYKGKEELVNLYPNGNRIISQSEINNAEAQLEYQFLKALLQLTKPSKPLVAYSIGNGEPTGPETFSIQEVLKDNYQLFTLDISKQAFIPDTLSVLMIVKPSVPFSENDKLKIDQFIMRGGKALFFIDALIAEQDSLQIQSQTVAYDRNLNLDDLLFQYGARINKDLLLDLQCDFLEFVVGGSPSNPQTEFLQWNYFPVFQSLQTHIINRGLGLVKGQFVNSVDTINTKDIKKKILLNSSTDTRTIATPALISLNENRITPKDEKFNRSNIPVAVLLEGRFRSLYQYRVGKIVKDSLVAMGVPFKENATDESKLIVVGDGDLVLNEVSQQLGPLPMGWNKFTYSEYMKKTNAGKYFIPMANTKFLQNCLEYLTQNPAIIEAGNKEITLRLLDSKRIREQKTFWQLLNIVFPILVVLIAGIGFQQAKKRKYRV